MKKSLFNSNSILFNNLLLTAILIASSFLLFPSISHADVFIASSTNNIAESQWGCGPSPLLGQYDVVTPSVTAVLSKVSFPNGQATINGYWYPPTNFEIAEGSPTGNIIVSSMTMGTDDNSLYFTPNNDSPVILYAGETYYFIVTAPYGSCGANWNSGGYPRVPEIDLFSPYPLNLPVGNINFVSPTDNSISQDFVSWHVQSQVTNINQDYYDVIVVYGQGSQAEYTDVLLSNYLEGTSTIDDFIQKSHILANSTSDSNWTATAYILDTSLSGDFINGISGKIIATSPVINFTIYENSSNASSSNITLPSLPVYTTSTPSLPIADMGFIATSTCSGWTDIGCEIGNVFANTFNFLFGIDNNTIQAIAGFQLANTPPFNFISQIQADFANANTEKEVFATSSISFNLGNGSSSVVFFSADTIHRFIPDNIAGVIRNIIFLLLNLEIGYLIYIEIKGIFGKTNK